jgi:adenylate kinase family enzyme
MTKTVIEAYLNKYKQLIILVSGFSGSGKGVLSKSLAKDFKIKYMNLNDYYKDNWDKESEAIEIDDHKIVDWDTPESINWERFNEDIEKNKKTGVIVSGFSFPQNKLALKPDFHIHLKITKDDLLQNRKDYVNEREDSKVSELDDELSRRILNKISYPHYMKSLEDSFINKFINIKSGREELKQGYNNMFDYLIENIEKKIY